MKSVAWIMILFCTLSAHADEIYPTGCVPLVLSGDVVHLPVEKLSVTMFHNLSSDDLWITHAASGEGVNRAWSSRLQASNWSALIVKDDPIELSCIESRPGHEQHVACVQVLAACQWQAIDLPKKSKDTVFAAENMQLSPLMAYIDRQGFKSGKNDTLKIIK